MIDLMNDLIVLDDSMYKYMDVIKMSIKQKKNKGAWKTFSLLWTNESFIFTLHHLVAHTAVLQSEKCSDEVNSVEK